MSGETPKEPHPGSKRDRETDEMILKAGDEGMAKKRPTLKANEDHKGPAKK